MLTRNEPYVGPRPFEQADKQFFFGRNQESHELISLIIAHSVVLLYAPSGAGKTSLLRAKILPALDDIEEFDMLPPARVRAQDSAALEDEKINNIYMYNALKDLSNNQLSPLERANIRLAEYLKQRPRAAKALESQSRESGDLDSEARLPRAIVFDQMEELFTFFPERYKDRQDFFEQIVEALEADSFLRVIISMREDFIAEMDPYADILPEKLRTRFRLERLRERTALTAVTEPLKAEGLAIKRHYAPGVAEKLVNNLLTVRVVSLTGQVKEVKGEFVDPVQLQVVCQTLWENLTSNETEITEKHLAKFGDVNLALIKFYEKCIQKAVDAANKQRKENEPELRDGLLRGWIERVLITREGTRGIIFRGHGDRISGIPVRAVEELESQHLVRAELRGGQVWYELSHDRFIQPIMDSNRRHLLKQPLANQKGEELEKKAIQWLDADRPAALLLDAGGLSDAKNWMNSPEGQAIGYSETLFSWVTASQTAIDQVENKRNQQLVEEQKMRLASEQLRAADQRNRNKQLKLGLTMLSLLFIVAAASAVLALTRGRTATKALRAVQEANKKTEEEQQKVRDANAKLETQNLALIQKNTELEEERQKVKKASDEAILERDKAVAATKVAEVAQQEAEDAKADLQAQNKKLNDQNALLIQQQEKITEQTNQLRQQTLALAYSESALKERNKSLTAANEVAESEVLKNRAKVLSMNAAALNRIEDYESSARLSLSALELSPTASIMDVLRDTLRRISDIPYVALKPGEDSLGRYKRMSGASFTPDGKTIVTTSTDGPGLIWKQLDGKWKQTAKFGESGSRFTNHDVSEDGRYVVTGHDDGVARMWGTDGKLMREFKGHTAAVHAVAFSPNGQYLATEAMDGTGRIWDVNTGASLATLNDLHGPSATIAFNPDGTRLVTEVMKKIPNTEKPEYYGARVWTVPEGKEVFTLKAEINPVGGYGGVTSVAYSPNGKYLLTRYEDGSARVWDADKGTLLTIMGKEIGFIRRALFSPDSRYLAAISTNKLHVFEERPGKGYEKIRELPDVPEAGSTRVVQISSIAFSQDSNFIVTSSENTAKVWNIQASKVVAILKGHSRGVLVAAFAPDKDKRLVLTASMDNTARLWDVTKPEVTTSGPPVTMASVITQQGLVYDTEVFSEGENQQYILTAGSETEANIYTMAGKRYRNFNHPSNIFRSSFSRDGRYVATTGADGILRIWERNDDKKPLYQISSKAFDAAISPDNKIVAAATFDGTVELWDMNSQKLIRTLTGHTAEVLGVSFNRDGTLLASVSLDGTVRVWNVSDGSLATQPLRVADSGDVAYKAVFSPDGESIAIATSKEAARLWKWKLPQSSTNPSFLCGHTGIIFSVAFNSTGDLLVTASEDKTARVWDVGSGKSIAILRGHTSEVYDVAFSPAGNFIATGSADRTVRLYPKDAFQPIEQLRALAEKKRVRKLDDAELNTYLSESDEKCATANSGETSSGVRGK